MTKFSRSGCSPRLFAISGIATAIIVESSPSMKKAQPMTSGIRTLSRGSRAEAEEGVVLVNGAAALRLPQSPNSVLPRHGETILNSPWPGSSRPPTCLIPLPSGQRKPWMAGTSSRLSGQAKSLGCSEHDDTTHDPLGRAWPGYPHLLSVFNGALGEDVGGRNKSGHGGLNVVQSSEALSYSCSKKPNRTAVGRARPRG